ncbi:hypothetical protein BD779DRAFT_1046252 [Infundibulicybe gibba]|nr:hypothetical protein BD779DRAFT_1046252 [Infundibulicybe gibba]
MKIIDFRRFRQAGFGPSPYTKCDLASKVSCHYCRSGGKLSLLPRDDTSPLTDNRYCLSSMLLSVSMVGESDTVGPSRTLCSSRPKRSKRSRKSDWVTGSVPLWCRVTVKSSNSISLDINLKSLGFKSLLFNRRKNTEKYRDSPPRFHSATRATRIRGWRITKKGAKWNASPRRRR